MKRILITGKNSYIGNACEEWLNHWAESFQIDKISVRDDSWKKQSWKDYDVIIHVAGIAHNSSKSELESLYFKINSELTYEIGQKAKNDGVTHFINLSSIIVFGTQNEEINTNTKPNPDNFYGESKLKGENLLNKLRDESFRITHIRPPMVYGKNSKGNFPLLAKMAKMTPIFPDFKNKRSMIYIKNLTELIKQVIEGEITGYVHPQNSQYIKTSDLVKCISEKTGSKVLLVTIANPLIKFFLNVNIVKKIFGDLYYSTDLNDRNINYQIYDLESSIQDIYS